jgi:phospholipid/cholesterol/gamma-HCH transport system permease protein
MNVRTGAVEVLTDREGGRARILPAGPFDLEHAATVMVAIERAQSGLNGCQSVALDLAGLTRVDGTGAILLARLLDRLESTGYPTQVLASGNQEAARMIALYRKRRSDWPSAPARPSSLSRVGAFAASLPQTFGAAFAFIGDFITAVPKAIAAPSSTNWRSLPQLIQEVGADSLPVTSAANLLVGLIIAFLGVSQLGRFGATTYVPELVVVAQFRELGPLVTAIVVAGRSGAGLAAEIATMKVSEEIDALRSMGFDPMRWVVLPRCIAMVLVVPLLTWVGNVLALVGGLVATTAITDMPPRAYIIGTSEAITGMHFATGLIKTPFLALSIALIACGQGLATRGGAAGVGARTTKAVVQAIFSVILIDLVFTLLYVLAGI